MTDSKICPLFTVAVVLLPHNNYSKPEELIKASMCVKNECAWYDSESGVCTIHNISLIAEILSRGK